MNTQPALTPLMIAADKGDARGVAKLLASEKQSTVNQTTRQGMNALMFAILGHCPKLDTREAAQARQFFSRETISARLRSALALAHAQRESKRSFQQITLKGAQAQPWRSQANVMRKQLAADPQVLVDRLHDEGSSRSLAPIRPQARLAQPAEATQDTRAECVRLLAKKTNLSALASWGYNPLHLAARCGNIEALRVLLPRLDANAQTLSGHTALRLAVLGGHFDCVRLLAPLTDLSAQDNIGYDVIEDAIRRNDVAAVRALSPFVGANLCALTGLTALGVAARSGRWECVDILAEHSKPQEAQALFKIAGSAKMPEHAARLARKERDELVKAVNEVLQEGGYDAAIGVRNEAAADRRFTRNRQACRL